MLHKGTGIDYQAGTSAAILPAIAAVDNGAAESSERRKRVTAEQALDQVLADSFPASDPPSWNPGIALVSPAAGVEPRAERSGALAHAGAPTGATDVIDVSRPGTPDATFPRSLLSLAGAAGIALLVPFVILSIGLPIALTGRAVLELLGWLFGVVF